MKVLVIDDEPDLREIISYEFSALGAQVTEAANGKDAQGKFLADQFDLIVSDIRMPAMDGIAFLKWLRTEKNSATPLILITGFADLSPQNVEALGGQGLFNKPMEFKALMAKAKEILKISN